MCEGQGRVREGVEEYIVPGPGDSRGRREGRDGWRTRVRLRKWWGDGDWACGGGGEKRCGGG